MSADESRPQPSRRARPVEKKELSAGPARDLRDAVYRLYAEADRPQLAQLAQQIAGDDDLPGAPGKDLIGKIISGDGLAGQQDTVTVAVALARAAGHRNAASIAEQVRQWWIAAATAAPTDPSEPVDRLGLLVGDCDPLALEVHPAIQVSGDATVDVLPDYVPRAHDTRLRELVDGMLADGRSRLVALVGGSSTGKTRACWELAWYLEQQRPGRWRLWHPLDPTRPQAALANLAKAGPDTIVWLNEAQHYLMPADLVLAERIAAGLRILLTYPGRGPVLILATLWPTYWTTLTTRPTPESPDVYGQARDLLALGTKVALGDTFTPAEFAGLADPGIDARLRHAAEHAEGGRITQYLAGAPALEDRYRTAPPAARAILQVAIDARRLGHPVALPHALLEHAAHGYLDDHDWDSLGDDWLEVALAYTAHPCKGVRGPLTRIRARPGTPDPVARQPYYRLADYLEQTGRTERAGVYPPESLWGAFSTVLTDPVGLRSLGHQAEKRGRYQHAIRLYQQAVNHGDINALLSLSWLRESAGDQAGAEALAVQAADHGNTLALQYLAVLRERAGDRTGAEAVAVQAAEHGDATALYDLAKLRENRGDRGGAEALYQQAADHGNTKALQVTAMRRAVAGDRAGAEVLYQQAADHGDTTALRDLARLREQAGDQAEAEALYQQAADHGDTSALHELVMRREKTGDPAEAANLALRAADLGDPNPLEILIWLRDRAGDQAGVEALYQHAANHGNTNALEALAVSRETAGDRAGAEDLAAQAADHGNTNALQRLAILREEAGDQAGAEALYQQAADYGDTNAAHHLAWRRERAGDRAGAEALYQQAADHSDTTALRDLARLREQAGKRAEAEALAVQAANYGDTSVLQHLAAVREQAGDDAGAEALYRQAVDYGGTSALQGLARLRTKAGDDVGADHIRRFGLPEPGE